MLRIFISHLTLDDTYCVSSNETTGGLGGLSICLINSCKLLNIVEITPIHSKVIENNLSIYNFDKNKYKIINDDYMNVRCNCC